MRKHKCQPTDGPFILTAILCFVLWCSGVQASNLPFYYPQTFRAAIQNPTSSNELKGIIFEVLHKAHLAQESAPDLLVDRCPSSHTTCYRQRQLSYRYARTQLFGSLHLESRAQGYFIKGVYCSRLYGPDDFPDGKIPGPGLIPSHYVMNTEHTWPQSKFSSAFPKGLQKGDLHILFPVDSRVNSVRSNHPFGDVSVVLNSPCPQAKRGRSGRSERMIFEPADEHKGNAARAIFYFSVRYKMPIDSEQEEFLKRWANFDPVDEFERMRNEKIFEIQGNRNPFIDHPELHSLIEDF